MTNTQIVELYERGDMSIEDIAKEFSLEVEAVKMTLISGSTKYRRALKEEKELFTKSDLEAASQIMSSLLYAENEAVRYRASRFIINEKCGRNDVKELQNVNLNVNLINMQLSKAREAIERGKCKVIET